MYQLIRNSGGNPDGIQQRKQGKLEYLVFPKLEKTGVVEHLFTTRTGGVSSGIYSTMNLSFSRGHTVNPFQPVYRWGEPLNPRRIGCSTAFLHKIGRASCRERV